MAKYQRVKFTGERTGLERIRLPRHGTVGRGDEVLVPAEDAERWATALPTAQLDDNGQQVDVADFETVGGEQEMTRQEYNAAMLEARTVAAPEPEGDRTVEQLRDELRAAGKSTSGNKAELQARLGEGGTTAEEEGEEIETDPTANADAGDGEGDEA